MDKYSQNILLSAGKFSEERNYWLDKLSGEFRWGSLPVDFTDFTGQAEKAPSPTPAVCKREVIEVTIPANRCREILHIANRSPHGLYIFLLAGTAILLHRYSPANAYTYSTASTGEETDTSDLVLGMPAFQQTGSPTAGNLQAIRISIDNHTRFKDLLLQLKETVTQARKFCHIPFLKIAQLLNLVPPGGENESEDTLFKTVVLLENIHGHNKLTNVETVFSFLWQEGQESHQEKNQAQAGQIQLRLAYDAGLFSAPKIKQLCNHLVNILGNAAANPGMTIGEMDLLGPEEKQQLLLQCNGVSSAFPATCIAHLFAGQVDRNPDYTITVGPSVGKNFVTYPTPVQLSNRELANMSNHIARQLKTKGAAKGSIVGVMVEPCLEMVPAIMGILNAGSVFLPIEPATPPERVKYLLDDGNVNILLTRPHPAETVIEKTGIINLREIAEIVEIAGIEEIEAAEPIGIINTIDQSSVFDPVYVIYTSGTTGKPKGVLIHSSNLVNYVYWFSQTIGLSPADRAILTSSFAFDALYTQFFSSMLVGCQLHVVARDTFLTAELLINYLQAQRITYIKNTPSLFNIVVNSPVFSKEKLKKLRFVMLGGEEINVKDVEKAHQMCPHLRVMNHYGPTETTIGSIARFIDFENAAGYDAYDAYKAAPTIGKPLYNTQVYVLDKSFNMVPPGVVGGLFIGGAGVGMGYLNKVELTAERFIRHLPGRSGVLYCTGDLARWQVENNGDRSDSHIQYLGRADDQVKIRGYRVELGEIEGRLLKYPGIRDVALLVREEKVGDKYLCAYIVCEKGVNIPELKLREWLLQSLPGYMVPSYFVPLEKIPLTPHAKLDRRALPQPLIKAAAGYAAPEGELEKKLVALWAEVLGIDGEVIGIDSNFFQIGGQSLKATVLAARVHKELNIKLSPAEFFKMPTIRALSDYIAGKSVESYESIPAVEKRQYYELSSAQKRLYILQQLELESTAYNMPGIIPLPPLETGTSRIEAALQKLLTRHESLRTSFHMIGDRPVQVVHEPGTSECKLEYYGIENQNQGVNHFIRPFDLSQAPLVRVGILNTGEGEGKQYLLIDMHHIITDGISRQVLRRDFMFFYQGDDLLPLRLQYKDFAQWQNSEKEQEKTRLQEQYWLREFAEEPGIMNLPLDYPRPAVQSFAGDHIEFTITGAESDALKEMALSGGVTLFMLILGIFNILLSKLSGLEDIVIGTPVAGRRHADLEKIIGMFVNTLPLRNYPGLEKTFPGFLSELRERTLAAFENQEYPFEELVEKLSLHRDMGHNPLFDVMFSLLAIDANTAREIPLENTNALWKQFGSAAADISKFDLSLNVVEFPLQPLQFSMEYCTRLFSAGTIERFINYFKKIISSLLAEPGIKINEIEIISVEEKSQLLHDFNRTEVEYPQDKTIHELFAGQATQTPDYVAVFGHGRLRRTRTNTDNNMMITYSQLNEKSGQLAGLLIEKGVLADDIIAIKIERSVEMVIGILGILKSGGAYLPIDPEYPQERIDYMLKDSGAALLAVTNELEGEKVRRWEGELKGRPRRGLQHSAFSVLHSNHLCYVIYTSGSTGKPKGVMVEHGSVVNLLYAMQDKYPFAPGDTYLLKTAYVFDVSVTELFGWYMGGGKLAILEKGGEKDPQIILDWLERCFVSHINFVPSMFNAFVMQLNSENIKRLASLKYIFLAGEALLPGAIKKFRSLDKSILLENIYGPTESSVYASYYSLSAWNGSGNIPIGRPMPNITLYILDRYNRLQPAGVVGELYIGGMGLARGYLNRPELTREKFEFNKSYRSNRTNIFYKTGDLARWLPNGNIEFLGRIDHQVKIRGFRVELGEIESHLSSFQGIKEAVVTAREDGAADKYLCAYFVSEKEYDAAQLQEFLAKELPAYMIPAYFIRIDKIPLTPSGKMDRNALPLPGPRQKTGVGPGFVPPQDEIETKLVQLWAEVLARDNVQVVQLQKSLGTADNFFQLGGHSLKATVLIHRINKELHVRVPLSELFKTPTIGGLSEYIRRNSKQRYEAHEVIEPVEKKEYYELSSAQRRLYILQQMELTGIVYNITEFIPLPEEIEIEKLQAAFTKLIDRHESLRTSFHMSGMSGHGDQPVQKVHDRVAFEIEVLYNAISWRSFIRSFDLAQAPLLRVGLLKAGKGKQCLLVDMHHIITDGISQGVLRKDFMAFYKGEQLTALRIQYKDFAQWQNSEKEREKNRRQEQYWLKEFAGEPGILNLPLDYPRPMVQGFEGGLLNFFTGAKEARALKQMALEEELTSFMAILGIFNVLLAKLSGQEDIIVGIDIDGRSHADLYDIIGMFVNTLALRNFPAGEKTFSEFLKEIKQRSLKAFENRDYPFEDLVEKIPVARDMGRNPVFDVMFSFMDLKSLPDDNNEPGDQLIKLGDVDGDLEGFFGKYEKGTARFDLTFSAGETPDGFKFAIEYCTKLFRKETICRFAGYLEQIISSVVENRHAKISGIQLITPREKKQVLFEFNNTAVFLARDKSYARLFLEEAEKTPDRLAAVCGDCRVSFAQLNRESSYIAEMLLSHGVTANQLVPLYMERSIEMLSCIIGVLKSGGAYVPIEVDYPASRVEYILQDCDAPLVLTGKTAKKSREMLRQIKHASSLEQIKEIELLCPAYGNAKLNEKITADGQDGLNEGDNLAYIIYTSGTTGKPKGVMIHRLGMLNHLYAKIQGLAIESEDVIAQTASACFDISVWQFLAGLLKGAVTCIIDKETVLLGQKFLQALEKNRVSIVEIVPSLLAAFLEAAAHEPDKPNKGLKHLRWMIPTGEPLTVSLAREWFRSYPGIKLVNAYGPTEASDDVTHYIVAEIPPAAQTSIPIGKPLPNLHIYILDKHLSLCPVGVRGEICVSGIGVGKGYWKDEEKTRKAFIPNPYLEEIGNNDYARLYKTGDTGYFRPDGHIECLGRIDSQVKIRGFRIELGEIENELLGYPGIKEVAVEVKEPGGEKVLCAYIVSDVSNPGIGAGSDVDVLREYLAAKLPGYMIPAYFIYLEKLPLTHNGKIDRAALPGPGPGDGTSFARGTGYTAPRDNIEAKLVQLWAEILGKDPLHVSQLQKVIGLDDNFFQLGGHSLKATIMVSKIQREFGVSIPLVEVFKNPTTRHLSAYINTNSGNDMPQRHDHRLVLLKKGAIENKDKHLFFIHDGTGEVEGYLEFCKNLHENFNCWGIRANRFENIAPQDISIRGLAQSYIENIKTIQPHGPYYLTGWSLGGTIVFEMAAQLEQTGQEIAFLALVDSLPPHKKLWQEITDFNLKTQINVDNNHLITGRILHNACAHYFPGDKLKTQVHYFKASQSKKILHRHWEKYCRKSIQYYTIRGDHFSIFKMPDVIPFAGIFENAFQKFICQ